MLHAGLCKSDMEMPAAVSAVSSVPELRYGGGCNLRFDDTNPDTEETEYVESIQEDVCWVCQEQLPSHCHTFCLT